MGSYRKLVDKVKVEGSEINKITYNVFDNGSCQCFKDCDCYSRKGLLLGTQEIFTHPLSTKQFSTSQSCEQSYNSKLLKT